MRTVDTLVGTRTIYRAELIFLDTVFTSFDAQVDHTGIANYVLKAKIDTICIMDVGESANRYIALLLLMMGTDTV